MPPPQNQTGVQLQADDIAKLFGTQDNFNMLKSLLNQTNGSNIKAKQAKLSGNNPANAMRPVRPP